MVDTVDLWLDGVINQLTTGGPFSQKTVISSGIVDHFPSGNHFPRIYVKLIDDIFQYVCSDGCMIIPLLFLVEYTLFYIQFPDNNGEP